MIQSKQPTAGNAINGPFKQTDWFVNFWVPLLQFLPSFGGLIRFGWTVEAIRGRTPSDS